MTEKPVVLRNATATFSQTDGGEFSVAKMIDGITDDNLGWGIYPNVRDQAAVFETAADIGNADTNTLTFSLLFNHKSVSGTTGHTLGRFRFSVTSDSRDSFADALPVDGDVSANWSPVEIVFAFAQSGAALTKLADNSLLVSGVLQEDDLYTITTATSLKKITGIRLEALTDPSLPHGGPGREPLNGNFVLAEFTVTVRQEAAPAITAQPASVQIAAGENAVLQVAAASGLPISYQWFFNGVALRGATNANLNLANAASGNAGTYWVVVSNAEGSTQSSSALVEVLPPDSSALATLFVSNRVPSDAPILDLAGQPLEGGRYFAQVYTANSASLFTPAGSPVPFLTGTNAGYFTPINLFLPDVTPGSSVRAVVFVWDSVAGATYEQAAARGGPYGSSRVLEAVTGGAGAPAPAVEGLKSFALVAPARIDLQPADQSALAGQDVTFSVRASGTAPLQYQWLFGGVEIPGAASATLNLARVSAANAGEYQVRVANPLGTALSRAARLTVNVPDTIPPLITISSPASPAFDPFISLSGTIADAGGIAAAQWERDGQSQGRLTLQDGRFSIPNVELKRGTNVFRVIALDASGNEGSASVTVVLEATRILSIVQPLSFQEGSEVVVPIQLASRGDVAGVTFELRWDATYLEEPRVEWDPSLAQALVQSNTNNVTSLRASFALSGSTITAGTQHLANVILHARSVPGPLQRPLTLSLVGAVSASGDSLNNGTDARSGTLLITKRRFVGDNNANDRLDVGDASILMRLVNLIDLPRPWDTAANDLNTNQQLDIGDVIRVLRAVVGIDPQPGSLAIHAKAAPAPASAQVRASLSKQSAAAGEKVTLAVSLPGFDQSISGFSFKLKYPVAALRLEDAEARQLGASVPRNSLALWNLSPKQDDYLEQDGTLWLAVSSDTSWKTDNASLAEFTFTVQTGATNQHSWPLEISAVELSTGFSLIAAPEASTSFTGRELLPPVLTAGFNPDGTFNISLAGEDAPYLIESSDDLRIWTELSAPPGAPAAEHRFYRARFLQP